MGPKWTGHTWHRPTHGTCHVERCPRDADCDCDGCGDPYCEQHLRLVATDGANRLCRTCWRDL